MHYAISSYCNPIHPSFLPSSRCGDAGLLFSWPSSRGIPPKHPLLSLLLRTALLTRPSRSGPSLAPSLSAAPLHPSYISPFPSLPALPSLPFSPLSAQLSIFETAAATPQLSTLTALVTQAGLAGVLTAPGNYTVFAPVNTAFAAIPAPLVNWLTNSRTQNAAALSSTLLYHVLGSVVYSNVIVAAGSVAITPLCASCLPPLNAYQNPASGLLYIRTGTTVLATITLTVRGDRFLRSRSVGGAGGRCGCGGIEVAPMP